MKRLPHFAVLVVAAFLGMIANLSAQQVLTPDTLVISPLPPGNVNDVINGDTLAGGIRAHPNRVYELKRGLVYQVSAPMAINGSITIMDSGSANTRPPVLAPQILTDNSSAQQFFYLNGKGSTVTMKNIYITAFRSDGKVYGWDDGVDINADSVKFTLEGDVFDGWNHTGLQLNGQWCKMLVTDCVFRNEIHSSAWFGGGSFLSNGSVNMDTTLFVNNTIFCNNSYLFSVRGYCPNAVFSHNTVVYSCEDPFLVQTAQNIRMDNNLLYGVHSDGGVPGYVINSWPDNFPDTAATGIIQLQIHDTTSAWYVLWGDTTSELINGPEVYIGTGGTGNATVTTSMVDPAKRFYDLRNNDYFWPQALYTFAQQYNDTVKTMDTVQVPDGIGPYGEKNAYLLNRFYLPVWMTGYSRYVIGQMMKDGAHVDTSGNMNLDPQFSSDIQAQINPLLNYVGKIASGYPNGGPDSSWYYTGGAFYPPTWPLPENLAYQNTALLHAGTDGFALGDLDWFPDQKAAWLAAGGLALGIHKVPDVLPSKFDLSNNYPNPFNPSTSIRVSLVKSGDMSLRIYNLLGQLVKVVDQGYKPAGEYIYNVAMDNFASGVYFYTLQQGPNMMTKKMILLK